MAIQFMDNFQIYNSSLTNMVAGTAWSIPDPNNNAIVDDPDPNADVDSKVLEFNSFNTSDATRVNLPSPGQQVGMAARLWFSVLPSSSGRGVGLQFNNAANQQMYCAVTLPTGAIRVIKRDKAGTWTDTGDTVLATTSGPVVTSGAWYHWEFFMDTATGDYELRIEGVTVLSGNDATHHTDSIAIACLLDKYDKSTIQDGEAYAKDVIVWDDTGTVNNTFIGPVTIYSLQVDGDVSDTNVTPSTGATNYGTMDELNASDVDYAAWGATPAEAVMTFENVPADVVAIRAIQTMVRAQKTDGGDATMQVGLVSGASEDTGSDDANSTSFRYHYDVSELDPAIAAAWTPVSVNAATIRINRTL